MITSIVIEWFNCTCHYAEDLSRSRISVYRRRGHIVYEEFNGRNNLLSKQEGDYPKLDSEPLFSFLEGHYEEMTRKSDYSIPVDDGFRWKFKMRHSNHLIDNLSGTVEFPPYGEEIENRIRELCEQAKIGNPVLFGCSSHN